MTNREYMAKQLSDPDWIDDGGAFNACFDWFKKYLSEEEKIEDALKKMEKLKQAVNSVVRKEE